MGTNKIDTADVMHVLTNSDLYARSLAGGVVIPASVAPDYGDPVTASSPESLCLVDGGIEAGVADRISGARTGLIPILLELELARAGSALDVRSEVSALPLNMVRCAVFRSEDELSDFKALPFDDLDVDSVEMKVDPDRFRIEGNGSPPAPKSAPSDDGLLDFGDGDSPKEQPKEQPLELHDKLAGGLCCLLQQLPKSIAWAEKFAGMVASEKSALEDHDPLKVADAMSGLLSDDVGGVIQQMRAAVEVFTELSNKEGWESTSVITSIADKLVQAGGKGKRDQQVERWRSLSMDILENRADCESLTDEGRVVLRAILLACLEKEPEAVFASGETYLRTGPQVRAVASFLTGLSSGYSRLPVSLKTFEGSLEFTWLLRERLIPTQGADLPFKPTACDIESEMGDDLTHSYNVRIDGCRVFGFHSEAPAVAQQILAMSRNVGYPLKPCSDTGYLKYTVEWRNGRRQPVYVNVLASGGDMAGVIRFTSPCEKLSMIEDGQDPVAAMKVVQNSRAAVVARPQLLEMLFYQSQPEWHCRFIIDYKLRAICIAVDQMVSTLDSEELTHHLTHVARIADEFELNRGRDDFR